MVDFRGCVREQLELDKLDYSDLLDKPFRLGSRGPDYYDCWGLCLEIGRRVSLTFPPSLTPDDTEQQNDVIRDKQDNDFEKIETPEPFCIVTFCMRSSKFVDHCGIVLDDCVHFLHTLRNHKVVRVRLDHKTLSKRIHGFYRLKN